MRRLIPLLVLVFPMEVGADGNAGSVHVSLGLLEGSPDGWRAERLSVRVYVGSLFLFQTPYRDGGHARWRNRIRAYTARSNPIVFRVVSNDVRGSGKAGGSRRAKPLRREKPANRESSNKILAAGIDELVDDWGEAETPAARAPEPESRVAFGYDSRNASGTRVLCTAVIEWPPPDGEHRLECGPAVLVVETRWLHGGIRRKRTEREEGK